MRSAGTGRASWPTGAIRCRADVDRRFSALIERRATREPVAFITGHREFWGLDFDVSPDVLIPRPETELIVEAVCERRGRREHVRTIVDVGTGSGCLAIVLAREFPAARVDRDRHLRRGLERRSRERVAASGRAAA